MSNLKPIRQSHTVNIVFDGSMFNLIELLRSKDLEIDFIAPGLMNSVAVMIVETEKKDEKTDG
jgi:hypothetical protein